MTNHGLPEEDSKDKDIWRNLVLDKEKPLIAGKSLDEDEES